MSGYTKLFSSILASTIWRAPDKTRLVWITLLAMADKNGVVEGSVPGLADFAHVSLPDCLSALQELQSPDEYSRSKDSDGRRLAVVDGGWLLINHGKYRNKLSQDERREYLRLKQREYRKRQAVNTVSTPVNNVSDTDTVLTHTAPAPAPSPKAVRTSNAMTATKPPSDLPEVFQAYQTGYLQVFGEKPNINGGKDGKLLNALLGKHGKESVLQRIHNMLHSRDTFIRGSGCTIGVLSSQWNKLRTTESNTGKTAGNLAALQRFAQRKTV